MTFAELDPGDYVVVETVPSGYTSTDSVKEATVSMDETEDLYFLNIRARRDGPDPSSITVVKHTSDGQPLNGATFALYLGGVKLSEETLAGSTYTWTGLSPGTYTVVEVSAPAGWIKATESKTASVSAGEDATVTFVNDPYGKGSITVEKLNTEDQPLSGATFALWLGDTKLDERVLAGNTHTWTDLEAGTYTVVEVAAPDGYLKADPDRVTVALTGGETTVTSETVTFRNPPAFGSITVLKLVRNEADGTVSPLVGVTFALFKPDTSGMRLDERILTGSEYTWTDLEPGTYTVVEVAAPNRPDGTPFELADPVNVVVPAGQNVRVEVYNNLPLTGVAGYTPQLVAGLSMIVLGLAVRRRRLF